MLLSSPSDFLPLAVSPLSSRASLYHHGRCTDVYDYGFGKIILQSETLLVCSQISVCFLYVVHPYGDRTSPGSIGAVPEVLFSEISKASMHTVVFAFMH